ncbi:MAG TPA: ATP-binding protein, partial [Lentzea sp.]
MTMPTGPDARELRLRASLLAHYELPWLGVDHEDGVLFPESRRVGVEPGVRRWCLDDSVRRSAVAGVRPKELRRVWSALVKRPDDPRQWAIDRFIGQNEGVSLEELDVDRVRAIGWLSRWLDLRHLPDQHSIDRALGMAALLEPLRAIADHTFVGRQDVLALLDDQLRQPGRPLLIHGMGGVGKSAVLARHLLAHVDDALVCYLNFDNSALDPAAPVSLVSAIAKQLVPQLPASDEISALVRSGADRLRSDTKLLDTSTRSITLRRNAQRYLQELSDVLPDRPRIFVFDTLEEVQRRSPAVQEAFAEFIESLAQHVTILLAGRSPAPAFGFASVELSVLPSEDAITLLRSLVDVPVAEAREVIQLIRVTPLCVRMAAGILRKHPTNNAFRDLALRRTAIEGELYHRLLGYIKDPDVRSLAHPGLTLRRVTPALIEQVLAKPCRITVPDGERAHHLFEELAREAMLVERLPSRDEVVH